MKLDVHYFLSAKYANWLIVGLIALFSLLTLLECSQLIWLGFESYESPVIEEKSINSTPKDSFRSILHSSLFGVYVSNNLNGENVKKSMLHVTIVGILLGTTPEGSQVIVRSAQGEEKNYKINDEIPGGALIKRIMADGILVEHLGNLESVSFPKDELTFEPVAQPLRND